MNLIFKLILIVGILLINHLSFSQVPSDSIKARSFYLKGDSLMIAGKYNASNKLFSEASLIYKNEKVWKRYMHSLLKMTENYRRSGDLESSLKLSEKLLIISREISGEHSLDVASAYTSIGIIYDFRSSFTEAKYYYRKSLELRKAILGPDHLDVAVSYNNMGIVHDLTGRYDSAVWYHKKALVIREKEPLQNQLPAASTHYNLGIVYKLMGDLEKAGFHAEKAYQIRKEVLGEIHPGVAAVLNLLGAIYELEGYYDKALGFYQKALQISLETLGDKHPFLVNYYNNTGSIYVVRRNFKQALDNFNKSASLVKDLFGENDGRLISSYDHIGELYEEKHQYDSALYYFSKALEVSSALYGKENHLTTISYSNQGRIYAAMGKLDSAANLYNKSLIGRTSEVGDKNTKSAEIYNALADIYLRQGKYEKAQKAYNKSLEANIIDYDPVNFFSKLSSDNALSKLQLLKTLYGQAVTKVKENEPDLSEEQFDTSLKILYFCDSLINEMRLNYNSLQDKIILGKRINDVYKFAISICYKRYNQTADDQYLELGFMFAEKSKAASLTDQLNILSHKTDKLLPQKLLTMDRDLAISRSYFLNRLLKLKQMKNRQDEINSVNDQLFSLNNTYDSLIAFYEKNYTKFYKAKYGAETISVSHMQEILAAKTAVIEYVVNSDMLYIFLITRKSKDFLKIPFNKKLFEQWKNLRKNMAHLSESESRIELIEILHKLYLNLIDPLNNSLKERQTDKLIFISDEDINYLPLEGLVVSKQKVDNKSFKTVDFLLNKFSVTYNYSATLHFNVNKAKEVNTNMISFGPSYTSDKEKILADKARYSIADNSVKPLKWNKQEAKSVAALFNGKTFISEEATESQFKAEASDAGIIHLAMHSFSDLQNPLLSRMIFQPEKDSVEDGVLHAFEISNLDINANMVVLSACNSGYGITEKGEGVMSLSRAFISAGASSVVMSQWQVDDKITGELMSYFYQFLNIGLSKDEALRKAKLKIISENDQVIANPYFWSSFILLGDTSPLKNSGNKFIYIILISGIILIIALLVYIKKRK